MCKLGDIIVVKEFKNENDKIIPKHSFVVIDDKGGLIKGLRYDFVSNMLCSFHDEDHKRKKLSYKGNMIIEENMILGSKINNKTGYIKANQLYYFSKNNIEYKVIAHIESKLLDKLNRLIIKLYDDQKLTKVVTNLENIK